ASGTRKGHVETVLVFDKGCFRIKLRFTKPHQHIGKNEIAAREQAGENQSAGSPVLKKKSDIERTKREAGHADGQARQQACRKAAPLRRYRLRPPCRLLACRGRIAHALVRPLRAFGPLVTHLRFVLRIYHAASICRVESERITQSTR